MCKVDHQALSYVKVLSETQEYKVHAVDCEAYLARSAVHESFWIAIRILPGRACRVQNIHFLSNVITGFKHAVSFRFG